MKLAYIERGHRHEDDEHDPVASLHIWVRVWHIAIVGRRREVAGFTVRKLRA